MIRRSVSTVCALLALGAAAACAWDAPLAPSANSNSAHALSTSTLPDRAVDTETEDVVTLRRSTPRARDIRVSVIIGPEGGELAADGSGAKIVFAPGALPEPTRITMTAKAGWNIAYEFCPHGISFGAPVVIVQELAGTLAKTKDLRTLQAGYYAQGLDAILLDRSQSVARVSELRDVFFDQPLNPRAAKFYIYHFSGYILSSGFAPGGDGSEDTPPPVP